MKAGRVRRRERLPGATGRFVSRAPGFAVVGCRGEGGPARELLSRATRVRGVRGFAWRCRAGGGLRGRFHVKQTGGSGWLACRPGWLGRRSRVESVVDLKGVRRVRRTRAVEASEGGGSPSGGWGPARSKVASEGVGQRVGGRRPGARVVGGNWFTRRCRARRLSDGAGHRNGRLGGGKARGLSEGAGAPECAGGRRPGTVEYGLSEGAGSERSGWAPRPGAWVVGRSGFR